MSNRCRIFLDYFQILKNFLQNYGAQRKKYLLRRKKNLMCLSKSEEQTVKIQYDCCNVTLSDCKQKQTSYLMMNGTHQRTNIDIHHNVISSCHFIRFFDWYSLWCISVVVSSILWDTMSVFTSAQLTSHNNATITLNFYRLYFKW